MNIGEACILALRAIRANKLRSALTTMGIIIGIAAVILLVGVGDGLKAGFEARSAPMATQITVSKVNGGVIGGQTRELTDSDVEALRDSAQTPSIATVTPVVTGSALASHDQNKFQTSVIGSTSDYLTITDQKLRAGQMFSDNQSNQRVAVLGSQAASTLFGGNMRSAVGEKVRLGRLEFTVIGILDNTGQNKDTVLVPLKAARSYLIGGSDTLNQLIVKAASPTTVATAMTELQAVLDKQHLIKDPTKRDYQVRNSQDRLEQMNETTSFISIFIVAIGAISLIVGGLGVANIMLVSVTERTREIGIRKAIGARGTAIMKQFLIEATVLAGLGGIAGMAFGIGLTLGAAQIIPQLAPRFGTPAINPVAVAVAFAVSLAIGLIAGGYPALRASRLRPIDALRFQ